MEIQELLKDYIVSNPVEKWTKELLGVFDRKHNHQLLNKHTAELGLHLLNQHPSIKDKKINGRIIEEPVSGDERYQKIFEMIPNEGWKSKELKDLLIYFFGAEKAECVAHAWDRIRFQMYQTGYLRRSFRAPETRNFYFINQINFLIDVLPQSYMNGHYPDYEKIFFDLSFTQQIKYDQKFGGWRHLFQLWSGALDLSDKKIFQQIEDIIFNKDEDGKVTQNIIKALLCSENEAAWKLVEKLLLAAQRQEGLRQIILEALDETSIGALKYIIKIIIDNKLTRFSSVVRAIDIWTGLHWESERESAVKSFLEKAHELLEHPEKIADAIASINNTEVYMALWAQGVFNIEKTGPFLQELYNKGNAEKRSLALKFAIETNYDALANPLYCKALDDSDLLVLAWALRGINRLNLEKYQNSPNFPELFDKLHQIIDRTDSKEKAYEGKIFSGTRIIFSQSEVFEAMIQLIGENDKRLRVVLKYFDTMNLKLREQLTRHILKDFAGYYWEEKKEIKPLTNFQRDYAMRILTEKGEFLFNSAFKALDKIVFSEDEITILQNLLKRKGAKFRAKVIGLILKQTDEKIKIITKNLLTVGDNEQRLAGLDIALQLQKSNRLETEIKAWALDFQNRKSISLKEKILLTPLTTSPENRQDFSYANGYGLWDFNKAFSPIIAPTPNLENYYEKNVLRHSSGVGKVLNKVKSLVIKTETKHPYSFSVKLEKVKAELEKLAAVYQQNKAFEYEIENWDNSKRTVLLGNTFCEIKSHFQSDDPQEKYNNYPLPEVWEKWYQQSGLKPVDLFLLRLSIEVDIKDMTPSYNEIMPKHFYKGYPHSNPILKIIYGLCLIHPFVEKNEFLLGACTRLFSLLEERVLKSGEEVKGNYYSRDSGNGWQNQGIYHLFYHKIQPEKLNNKLAAEYWKLANWRQFSGREENIKLSYPTLATFARVYEQKIISEDEMYRGIMTANNMHELSRKKFRKGDFNYLERFPFLKPMFEKIREHILNIEVKRGDSATDVSDLVSKLEVIYGANRLVELLQGLGKTPLNRGYDYYFSNSTKQSLFSKLIKICFPAETDTQKAFNDLVKKGEISEIRLIEAAVYAPQWQKFISNYLKWKGLDSAIWWMHAHTKIAGYSEKNAESESEIAKYSNVDLEDFKNGAVDKDWFLQAYREIGKVRWAMVYGAAKYISEGNGHRRARLYADVILGNIKLKEITNKVKVNRDQDYLRMYGLVPLSKTNAEKDILSRYIYLQKFKKESRQFGAQKQASEAIAMQIALENLARNAGYADPLRLSWAMETKQVQEILSKENEIKLGDVVVKLEIDPEGKAEIIVIKDGKLLKSVPPKFKKDVKLAELKEYKKTLREQFSRSRKSLEEAMIRGDKFLLSELKNLFNHPIISKHLEKLVFATKKGSGFFKNDKLISATKKETKLSESDEIRLAHCFDLYEFNEWSKYQKFCFENKLQQPFKQIFRELYLPTQDELKEKSISRRYAGHQVQPKQTVALLKTRGWKVDYEEGLQKVFHREGFAAKMYAMADWFSPAEVESPTLETIVFENLKDYKKRPFEEIDVRIFSEVMRDIDLVVSIAHAGGVDAEASHSTIEMRSVLLRETMRLFKLKNVEIIGNHAKIKGIIGEYTVHLGSAIVHKSGQYLSILPVHSQHRGRLFLPFADDDPKSAEVVSKILLLARDNEIQDPTILQQLL